MRRPWNKPRRARRRSIVLTATIAGIVLCSTFFHVPPDWPLAGAEKEVPAPVLTPRSWFDGSFAEEVEPWLLRRFGLRGFAIRLANQIDYSLFGMLPESRGTAVLQGRGDWLFERGYLRYYEGQFGMDEEEAVTMAKKLGAIEGILSERGVGLAVVISPSKLEVYPDYLPDGIRKEAGSTPAREQVLDALREEGVTTIDGRGLFIEWRRVPGTPPLFHPFGTHWNSYGAQRILDAIWDAAAMTSSIPHVIGYEKTSPFGMDTDLLDLLNLPFYQGLSPLATICPVLSEVPPARRRLRALLVGDSFCFQLIDAIGRTGAFSDARLLYYYRGIHDFHWAPGERPRHNPPAAHRTGFIQEHEAIDWKKFLDGYDIVILEFNEIFARKLLWGFADFVLPDLQRPGTKTTP